MQYERKDNSRMTISYSHRPRTSDLDFNSKRLSYKKAPGPGAYESLDMTPSSGKPKLSKNRKVKLANIDRDTRFKPTKSISPGPNVYNSIDNLSRDSRYYSSLRRGEGTRPFDQEGKFTHRYWRSWRDNFKPAPGAHELPSDFGVYGDYNYYKTMNTLRK